MSDLAFLADFAEPATFARGDLLFTEDADADTFYVVTTGRVGLELIGPGRPPMVIQTLGDGDLVGLSWLFPPYRWSWRARARTDVVACAYDAAAVRARCDADVEFARRVTTLVAREAVGRLHRARAQLLDLYLLQT